MITRQKHIAETIKTLENRRAQLEAELEDTKCVIDFLRFKYCPNETDNEQTIEPAGPAKKKKAAKKKTVKKPARRREHATGKQQSSQFKGVRKARPYADGRTRWTAQYYDSATKMLEHLGSFDNEYLAAAAWNDRDGKKTEAARLRKLAKQQKADDREQAENNPDRPLGGEGRRNAKRDGKPTYVCKRCGAEYQSNGICGCGCDLMKVPAK